MGSGVRASLRLDRRRLSNRIAMLMSWSSDRLLSRQANCTSADSFHPVETAMVRNYSANSEVFLDPWRSRSRRSPPSRPSIG